MMKPGFLLLMAVHMWGTLSAMSTCKTVDLEFLRTKRIEAIRSQILSKLRLPKAPEDAGEDEDIPDNLLSLYNSSKEKTEVPRNSSIEQEEEEYFAKVLNKFNMTKKNQTDSSKIMTFNISEIRKSVGDFRLLTSAEIRMLIKNTRIQLEQRVELYYSLGSSIHYHASKFISNSWKDKWLSFDVTEPLQKWLQMSEDEQTFHLRLFCECGLPSIKINFDISGTEDHRGDTKPLQTMTEQPPYILTMSIPQNMSSHLTSRRKRSTGSTGSSNTCSAQSETCCVERMYIDFRKDLGWKWIHEPPGYYANYCKGTCSYIWSAENKYSQILALYKHHNPGASAQPCCVPEVLEPLTILYYVGRQHRVEQLSNMIVTSCKCS